MNRADGKPTIASSAPLARVKRDAAELRKRGAVVPRSYVAALTGGDVEAAHNEDMGCPPPWTAIGLRLNPEELAALDAFRDKGFVPLSRAESARALVRRALGLGRNSR